MFKSILIIVVLSLLVSYCNVKTDKTDVSTETRQTNVPTAIAENLSVVEGKVISVKPLNERDFELEFKVTDVFPSTLPSLAVRGEKYLLIPNYVISSKNELIKNSRNKKLLTLRNSKAGEMLRLEIFLSPKNKWMIYKVLQKE